MKRWIVCLILLLTSCPRASVTALESQYVIP